MFAARSSVAGRKIWRKTWRRHDAYGRRWCGHPMISRNSARSAAATASTVAVACKKFTFFWRSPALPRVDRVDQDTNCFGTSSVTSIQSTGARLRTYIQTPNSTFIIIYSVRRPTGLSLPYRRGALSSQKLGVFSSWTDEEHNQLC